MKSHICTGTDLSGSITIEGDHYMFCNQRRQCQDAPGNNPGYRHAIIFPGGQSTIRPVSILIAAFIICLTISPANAFTAKNLDISVQADSNATITFDYDLTIFEQFAVFLRIADPAGELKNALESEFNRTVAVTEADGSRVRILVSGFASKHEKDGVVTMRTPSLSFTSAQKILDRYWFAPLIHPDFSPAVTRVSFPDGYSVEYTDQITIPAVTHAI